MSKPSLRLPAVCILAAVLGGCAGYLSDRAKDASEIVEFGTGWSSGLSLNLRATKIVQIGFGSYSGNWAGLREGRFATWREERSEVGFTPFHFHEVFRQSDRLIDIRHPLPWDPGYRTYLNDLWLLTDRGFFEVGITFNAVLFGIDLAVEAAEAADFVTGLVGIDILEDDVYSIPVERHVDRLMSRDAWKRYCAARALMRLTDSDFGYTLYTVTDEHTEDQRHCRALWKEWLEQEREKEKAGDQAPDE